MVSQNCKKKSIVENKHYFCFPSNRGHFTSPGMCMWHTYFYTIASDIPGQVSMSMVFLVTVPIPCHRFLFLLTVESVNLTKSSNTSCNPVISRFPENNKFCQHLVQSQKVHKNLNGFCQHFLQSQKVHKNLDGSQMLKMKLVEWPIVST